jgi:ketosteroid isomerase-like protein
MSSTSTLTPSDVVRGLFDATDAKDTAAKLAFISDDIQVRFGNAEPVVGRDAFCETSDAFNASLLAVDHEIQSLLEDSAQNMVVAELLLHYTRLDEAKLTLPCCTVFRLRDGLIADYRI